jgi:hypothetical protein
LGGGNHTGELAPLHDLAALSAPAGHLVLCIGTLNHFFLTRDISLD